MRSREPQGVGSGERLAAPKPGRGRGIERGQRRSVEAGEIAFDLIASFRLEISKVAITFGELREQGAIERGRRAGLKRIEAVLLIGVPPQNDAPAVVRIVRRRLPRPPSWPLGPGSLYGETGRTLQRKEDDH